MYKVGIVGTGYVGLTTGLCFTDKNGGSYKVVFYDTDSDKINIIRKLKVPFHEPGLPEMLHGGAKKKLVSATTDMRGLRECDVIFVCVGTPSNGNGSVDLEYIRQASKDIGTQIKTNPKYQLIVIKSTVIPCSTEKIVIPTLTKYSGKKYVSDFGVCMNPEFLTEGNAVKDGLNPSRIVIGSNDKRSTARALSLYKPWRSRTNIITIDIRTAEMMKYASNASLASRLGLANELARYCHSLGIDSRKVMKVVGMDPRIGSEYLGTGRGWGGSCFSKDLKGLIHLGEELNIDVPLLKSVITSNEIQKTIMVYQLEKSLGTLNKMTIAVLGLAFKKDTDDVRYSPAIDIIKELKKRGATVRAYDPKATSNMMRLFPDIEYVESAKDALRGTDGCLITTDWPEFADLTDDDFNLMHTRITKIPNIIEGLPILDSRKVTKFKGISW